MSVFTLPSRLVDRLRSARRVVVLTGAGVSAESGVPTFRDALTGLWSTFRPEELATPEAFRRQPRLVWEWYAWRRAKVAEVEPNPGHHALAVMEQRVKAFTLVTQNVDGLHQRAGSRQVLELHGNLMRTKCFEEGRVVPEWPETGSVPPRCPNCGGWLRPDVVWFGESLPAEILEAARQATVEADLFLSVGTSSVVYPAAGLIDEALAAGAWVVEVNPEPTPYTSRVAFSLRGPSGLVLPAWVRSVGWLEGGDGGQGAGGRQGDWVAG